MAKITKLEQKTFNNKPSGFTVTFDDGRSGNLQEKESDKGLRVGDEVLVTEIPYTSKAGKTSTLYGVRLNNGQATSPQQPQTGHAPAPAPKAPHTANIAQMKFDARMKVTELGINALLSGKFTKDTNEEEATKTFIQEWSAFTDSLVDEIFTGK